MNQELAINGGLPVRDTVLQYGSQWISEGDIEEVIQTLRSPFLTQGPKVQAFERAVADYVRAKYAVAFCNGTAALHGACFAAGIGVEDEVITTPLTFAASANCVLYMGGTPVFADVDKQTYLLDIDSVKEKITPRTKAMIPVDFTGQPINMMTFRKLADEHGLVFIQDAAHSLGASYHGERVGTVADMTMFSFHPVKPVTTGEGGVIVTDSEEYYEKLCLFRSHGITKDAQRLTRNEGSWYYEMQELGYNYRMTDLQAALGVSQMKQLDSFIARRREIAKQYHDAFEELEERHLLKRPYQEDNALSGWHLYVLQLQVENLSVGRREIFEALKAENIGVNVHYIPVHRLPYYEQLGYKKGLCPHAEQLYETFVTIPLFPKMANGDWQDVIKAVEKVLLYYVKGNI